MQPLPLKPEIANVQWISNAMLALVIGGCVWLQASADSARQGFEQILGQKYCGHVMEAGSPAMWLPEVSNDSVTTTFGQTKEGTLIGTYTVTQSDGVYTGTLKQRGALQDHAATFDWQDKYGTGTVTVKFDADYCRFNGNWSFDGLSSFNNSPWDGHRQ